MKGGRRKISLWNYEEIDSFSIRARPLALWLDVYLFTNDYYNTEESLDMC